MKKYGFHYINDSSREIISKGVFNDITEAIDHFAEIKKLSRRYFSKIYKVVLIDDKSKN